MKSLLSILSFLFVFLAEQELGQGIISVDIFNTKEIKVFNNKGDQQPEKVIRLIKRNGEIIIEEKEYESWLIPESTKIDYSQFRFRYTKIEDDWIQVIVNKESGVKKWIRKSPSLNVRSWEEFLVRNTTAIDPISPVDIKARPDATSKTIRKSSEQDCFEAVEIKGDWIRIKTNNTLDCNRHPQPIQDGWIRWRENNRLNIQYYTTC